MFRNTLRKVAGLLLALGLFTASPVQAQVQNPPAQQTQLVVGIPTNDMNVSAANQQKDEWCWAASIQMALSCYHVDVKQGDIVARNYGLDKDGTPVDQPATNDVITKSLNGHGVDIDGHGYTVSAIAGNGIPNAADLIKALADKHPVILGMDMGSSGHAVVCTAVIYENTANGPVIDQLIIRDPWPWKNWDESKGRYAIPANEFVSRVRSYWVVTATVDQTAPVAQGAQASTFEAR